MGDRLDTVQQLELERPLEPRERALERRGRALERRDRALERRERPLERPLERREVMPPTFEMM